MKIQLRLLTSTLLLGAFAAGAAAQDGRPGARFQTCIWPNPCGARGSAPIQPPAE